jgi:hypothetical protein
VQLLPCRVSVVFGIRREIVRSNNREVQIAYRRFGYCAIALLELFFDKRIGFEEAFVF